MHCCWETFKLGNCGIYTPTYWFPIMPAFCTDTFMNQKTNNTMTNQTVYRSFKVNDIRLIFVKRRHKRQLITNVLKRQCPESFKLKSTPWSLSFTVITCEVGLKMIGRPLHFEQHCNWYTASLSTSAKDQVKQLIICCCQSFNMIHGPAPTASLSSTI